MRVPVSTLPIFSALLGITAFSPLPYAWLAALVCLVPLILYYRREARLTRLLIGTVLYRFTFAAGTVYFAFEPLGWIVSAILFLGLPVSFHLVRRFIGPAAALAAFPLLWTLWDLVEARYTFLPMYVMALGNALAPSPFLGLAAWGGFIGPTLFAALVNSLIAAAFLLPRRKMIAVGVLTAIAISSGWLTSRALIARNAAEYAARAREIRVAAVSTGDEFDRPIRIFTEDTLAPEERGRAAERITALLGPVADELASRGPLDLVVLPEDMIDIESWDDADAEAKEKFGIGSGGVLIAAYREFARRLDVNVAATLTTIQDGRRYNTSLLFDRSGAVAGRYNKVHLALGGEYWPFNDWRPFYWNAIARVRPEITIDSPLFDPRFRYAAGEPQLLGVEGFSFASPICIEIHYPGAVRALAAGAGFIAHTASNRWVTIGLERYLRLTNSVRRVEAVWLSTPIVFSGRQEHAGLITPDGRIEFVPVGNQPYAIFSSTLSL